MFFAVDAPLNKCIMSKYKLAFHVVTLFNCIYLCRKSDVINIFSSPECMFTYIDEIFIPMLSCEYLLYNNYCKTNL